MERHITKKLSAVCDISAGNTAPQNGIFFDKGSFPFFRTSDVGKIHLGTIYKSQDLINEKATKSMRLFPKGTILFPKSGASVSLNHRVKMGVNGYVVSHLATIKANNDYLTDDFLLYYLMTIDANALLKNSSYPSLNISDLSNLTISFPSIGEQKRIAERLDKVQELITLQKEQLTKLDDLIKSRFIDLFGDPVSNPKEWPLVSILALAENLDHQRKPITASERVKGPYPYYGASGIVDYVEDFIFDESLLLISEDGANLLARTTPISFSISGKTWVNNHAHVLRFKDSSVQLFVEMFLNNINLSSYITGSAQPKLNQNMLNNIPIVNPPKALQTQFADFVAKIEKQKGLLTTRLSHLETLYKSLMQECFS